MAKALRLDDSSKPDLGGPTECVARCEGSDFFYLGYPKGCPSENLGGRNLPWRNEDATDPKS